MTRLPALLLLVACSGGEVAERPQSIDGETPRMMGMARAAP